MADGVLLLPIAEASEPDATAGNSPVQDVHLIQQDGDQLALPSNHYFEESAPQVASDTSTDILPFPLRQEETGLEEKQEEKEEEAEEEEEADISRPKEEGTAIPISEVDCKDEERDNLGDDEEEEEPPRQPLPPKGTEIFVGGISRDVTETELREQFAQLGEIFQLRLMTDPKTGESKGYAFVRFWTPEAAQEAVNNLDGKILKGRSIGVALSNDNQTLFLGHINKEWKRAELEMHLVEAKIEGLNNITIMKDPSDLVRNRGFAFVEFNTHHQAARAHGKMTKPDFRLGGMPIRCDWAEPLNEPGEDVMKTVKSIYVCNLPPDVNDEMMRSLFGEFGEIERIVLSKNLSSARREDFAFVNYKERESAEKAIQARHRYLVQERVLDVTLAKPKPTDTPSKKQWKQDKGARGGLGGGGGVGGGGWGGRKMTNDKHAGPGRGMRGGARMKRGNGMHNFDHSPMGRARGSPGTMGRGFRSRGGGSPMQGNRGGGGGGGGWREAGGGNRGAPFAGREGGNLNRGGGGRPPTVPGMGGPGEGWEDASAPPRRAEGGFRCDLCQVIVNSEIQLQQHFQGRQHSQTLQNQQFIQGGGTPPMGTKRPSNSPLVSPPKQSRQRLNENGEWVAPNPARGGRGMNRGRGGPPPTRGHPPGTSPPPGYSPQQQQQPHTQPTVPQQQQQHHYVYTNQPQSYSPQYQQPSPSPQQQPTQLSLPQGTLTYQQPPQVVPPRQQQQHSTSTTGYQYQPHFQQPNKQQQQQHHQHQQMPSTSPAYSHPPGGQAAPPQTPMPPMQQDLYAQGWANYYQQAYPAPSYPGYGSPVVYPSYGSYQAPYMQSQAYYMQPMMPQGAQQNTTPGTGYTY